MDGDDVDEDDDCEDAVVTVLVWRLVVNEMPMWFRLILTVSLFNVQIVNDCRVYISYIVS